MLIKQLFRNVNPLRSVGFHDTKSQIFHLQFSGHNLISCLTYVENNGRMNQHINLVPLEGSWHQHRKNIQIPAWLNQVAVVNLQLRNVLKYSVNEIYISDHNLLQKSWAAANNFSLTSYFSFCTQQQRSRLPDAHKILDKARSYLTLIWN